MKKILILFPKGSTSGSPSFQRVSSFKDFFIKNNCKVFQKEQPETFNEKVILLYFVIKMRVDNVFISMPQFNNWWLFLVYGLNIILDIRDGWSLGMKTGYGNTVRPKVLKSIVAQNFEKFAISRAALTITCTPGLQNYFKNITNKKILLVLNGYSKKDKVIVRSLKRVSRVDNSSVKAVCVGQFSEYGQEKAEQVLCKLSKDYPKYSVKLHIIGSDRKKNEWLFGYIEKMKLDNVTVEFFDRMGRKEMFQHIVDSDLGITTIRDPQYEFGTKVYDYMLCGVPIFNYFKYQNEFVVFFKNFFAGSNLTNNSVEIFEREYLLEKNTDVILKCLV
ncbi:MAG: hypothetical protein C0613_14950 [Desulfobulbaceae bacterium]|nr:MAG: hypothetical protein C0613_14950 [Desulfobulbaceae bacterium]